jgi:hypothetical protein
MADSLSGTASACSTYSLLKCSLCFWCNPRQELEEIYMPPPFYLEERYAHILTTIFTTFIYSGGMPAMLPLGFVNLVITFWVDKLLFFSFYRSPIDGDETIPRLSTSLLPYAAFVHLMYAIWMFSNPNLFPEVRPRNPDDPTDHKPDSEESDCMIFA